MSNVTLRTKRLKNNRLRLYLDFYPAIPHPDTGKATRREFLKLFLYEKPGNELERQHNKETKHIAEAIRARRLLDVQAGNYDFLSKHDGQASFLVWFKDRVAEREKSRRNYQSWRSTYLHLYRFVDGNLSCRQVTPTLAADFRNYFLGATCLNSKKKLKQNSAAGYFDVFKEAVKEAHAQGVLKEDVVARIKSIPYKQPEREFLSLEELQLLADADCPSPILKQAALFSALTGLRWGDVSSLQWENVRYSEEHGYFLRKQIEKTGRYETHFISEQARQLMGEKTEEGSTVFTGLPPKSSLYRKLDEWMKNAGIERKITFHAFRHTYATLQITYGTDISTLQKVLGHKYLTTTQIYTHIVDKRKREAASAIPELKL